MNLKTLIDNINNLRLEIVRLENESNFNKYWYIAPNGHYCVINHDEHKEELAYNYEQMSRLLKELFDINGQMKIR